MSHREILEALTGLLAALFTALISVTIVSTALPTIIADLHGSQTAYAWVITTALLTNAASTPIWGKLADIFNKKLLVQLAIVIFVAGSVLAGLSTNITMILSARAIQGIGMGGLTALVVAIIGTIVSPRERGRYSGYLGGVMAVAMSGGPIVGGLIVDSPLGWRWCFLISIPLAVVASILLQSKLRIATRPKENVSIDWLGALLMTSGVSVLLIWVSFAGDSYPWMSTQTAMLVSLGLALLALTVWVESRATDPVIPLPIIRQRTTALAIIASISVGIGLFGATTFLTLYFQTSRGYSPTAAGMLTIPMVAGMLLGSVGSGRLITRFGRWKPFLIAGSTLLAVGFLLLSTIDHATDIRVVGAMITVLGLGTGLLMQNLVLAVQNTVGVAEIGAASSMVAFFRTFGGAIGVSILGSVLATRVGALMSEALGGAAADGGSTGTADLDLATLPPAVRELVRAAYGDATGRVFLVAACVSVITILAVSLIPNRPLRTTIDLAQPTTEPSEEIANGSPATSRR